MLTSVDLQGTAQALAKIPVDDIKKKAAQKSDLRAKQKAAALKEVKNRKTTTKKVGGRGSAISAGQRTKIPKSVQRNNVRNPKGSNLR